MASLSGSSYVVPRFIQSMDGAGVVSVSGDSPGFDCQVSQVSPAHRSGRLEPGVFRLRRRYGRLSNRVCCEGGVGSSIVVKVWQVLTNGMFLTHLSSTDGKCSVTLSRLQLSADARCHGHTWREGRRKATCRTAVVFFSACPPGFCCV